MKNNLTFGQLDAVCMAQAGNLAQNDIHIAIRQAYVNAKLMQRYRMRDGLNDPWFNKSAPLTVAAADQTYLKDSTQGGTITALSVSGTVITITGPALVAGSLLNLTLVLASNGTVLNHCIARVSTGGTTSTATIISGTMITYVLATHRLSVIAIQSYSGTTIDLSDIYFKNIVRIYDDKFTVVAGEKTRVFTEYKDAQLFAQLSLDPRKSISIAWYQRGDTVELFVPSGAIALGTVMSEYRGKPALYIDSTIDNAIEMPPEDNIVLMDEVTSSYLIHRGKVPPPDIAARLAMYQKENDAAAAEAAKSLAEKNT